MELVNDLAQISDRPFAFWFLSQFAILVAMAVGDFAMKAELQIIATLAALVGVWAVLGRIANAIHDVLIDASLRDE